MANEHGGARPGAGRKSKAEEYRLFYLLAEAWPHIERVALLRKLGEKAVDGDLEAAKLLLQYAYGRPRECYLMENQPDLMDVNYRD